MVMNALRYNPESNEFGLQSVDEPEISGPDDVKIEVKFAGLCGTDLHIIQVIKRRKRGRWGLWI